MIFIYRIIIIGILMQFLCSCVEICSDYIHHEITDAEKEYFPYEYDDTMYYKDKNTDSLYYLTCTSFKQNWDTSYSEDERCGPYHYIFEEMDIKLISDFPHFQQNYALINIHLQTAGRLTSRIEIEFEDNAIL
ncbi:hypothetical protein ACFLTE_11850, partial [Bacteroidota bacterium]